MSNLLVYGIIVLSCLFSLAHAEDEVNGMEDEFLHNPPGYGTSSDPITVYSKIRKKTAHKAIDSRLDDIQNSMFREAIVDSESETDTSSPYLKLDKDGIKVYIFNRKNSDVATFKAITHIQASLDSVLAVFLDQNACIEWVHACDKSIMIKDVSFNERYHYQVFDIPFPFNNRDFIFHSILKQDPKTKTVLITMFSVPDYCHDKQSDPCQEINQSKLVRVNKSIGSYKFEVKNSGTKIIWTQHTDPAGKLPAWLVNQFIKDTPYWTFINLAQKVKETKYKYAKLIYGNEGIAVALKIPTKTSIINKIKVSDYHLYPTF